MPDACCRDRDVRLSVTDRCQLRCNYCLPAEGRAGHACGSPLTVHEIRVSVQALHSRFRIRRLRFTGGEPLLRLDIEELVREVAAMGIGDIALTTNRQLLAEDVRKRLNTSFTWFAMKQGPIFAEGADCMANIGG